MKNYYEILELDYSASFKEIRSSYRRLSKKYHPDLNPDNKEFEDYYKDIQEAYHHLKDGIKREEFDAQLRALGIGRSRFGAFTKNIRDRFSPNKNNIDWEDEDENGYSFNPVFAPPPKKRYYKGVILIVFSIVVIGGIFFLESRSNDLSYSSQISNYAVEPQMAEEEKTEEGLKVNIATPDNLKEELPLTAPRLAAEETDKIVKANAKQYNYTVAENPKADGETVPVTIFSVSNIRESKTEEPLTKQADLPQVSESKPIVSSPAIVVSNEAKEINPSVIENKSNSANSSAEANRVFTNVERKPTFSGGASAFVQYLNSSIQYPPSARESGINGRVLVTFIVEKNGKLSNISVIQGIGGGCDEEAIRVMKNAPSWIPGEHNGERVRVQCTIPITFKLQ